MSQFSMSISDEAGAAFLADVNSGLQALASNNSGASAPSTTYAYMMWADTANSLMKMRNAANSAWLTLFRLDNAHQTFTPTVTLVGGAGNTVPVYSVNSGRYSQAFGRAFVDVELSGDGGNEGAGTGQITIALPVAASASFSSLFFVVGRSANAGNSLVLFGSISSSLLSLAYEQTISVSAALTGADQNNTSRSIRLSFNYET